jgi:hypothetical protein
MRDVVSLPPKGTGGGASLVVVGAYLSCPARLPGARAGRIMALEMVRSALRGQPRSGHVLWTKERSTR